LQCLKAESYGFANLETPRQSVGQVITFEALLRAAEQARKGKRFRPAVIAFHCRALPAIFANPAGAKGWVDTWEAKKAHLTPQIVAATCAEAGIGSPQRGRTRRAPTWAKRGQARAGRPTGLHKAATFRRQLPPALCNLFWTGSFFSSRGTCLRRPARVRPIEPIPGPIHQSSRQRQIGIRASQQKRGVVRYLDVLQGFHQQPIGLAAPPAAPP
jgi:hypothetical protein